MKNLYVSGLPNKGAASFPQESRPAKIEMAIKMIQSNGDAALMKQYLGVKNYAGFGDQGCDTEYGYGPRHGHIVFKIGRTHESRNNQTVLGADEVYLLECCRDFGSAKLGDKELNLCDILKELLVHAKIVNEISLILDNKDVETHF
jgi:hypothetical protein